MFTINFRIVDDLDYWAKLSASQIDAEGEPEGFFKVQGGGNSYGYCHFEPLDEGEEGVYLVLQWAYLIVKAVAQLCSSEYVAIKDVESCDIWLEFQKINGDVRVRVVRLGANGTIVTEKKDKVEEVRVIGYVPFPLLMSEVRKKTENLMDELISLNVNFKNSQRIENIKSIFKNIDRNEFGEKL